MRFECGIVIDGVTEVVVSGTREAALRDMYHYLYQYRDDFKETLTVYIIPEQDDEDV